MKDEHVNDINNYQKLYMQYAPMLLRFAGKFISPFFAEDIVHDVFLKIWDKQVFLLSESEVKNILFVAVRNACIDHLRRISLEQEFADKRAIQLKLDELSFYDGADELFMRKDLMAHVMAKINELPEKRREIFLLSYMEGLKAAEIAERLNLSTRTWKTNYTEPYFSYGKSFRLLSFIYSCSFSADLFLFFTVSENKIQKK